MRNNPLRKGKARPTAKERELAVKSLGLDDKSQLINSLKRYLSDRSPYVRATALDVIRDQTLQELESQVLVLLSDRSKAVRYSATDCVGFLHADEGISATWLYPLLDDPDDMVRIEAIESLSQIDDQSALPLIARMLKDEAPLVRSYAATAIEDLDGAEFVQAIKNAMQVEADDRAKVGFAGALFYFGDASQFLVLLQLLSSPDYTTRCAAANTISSNKLTSEQMQLAFVALGHALHHPIARADQTTMERVLKDLLLQQAAGGESN
ncbi:MAG TPA: HEAT repeat domain-containing protein [Acidobacteriaceae bacterium]|jgi:HEAT repeat protein|nr:HEAT repeat domain-containing protein [Acidobacteriaceae bacterium]